MASIPSILAGRPVSTISRADDPRIAAFRDIRERDLTGRNGFIAEGTVVLDQLARSRRFRATALLVLESRLAGIADRIAALPPDCPVLVATRPVLDDIAGFPMHRGVLAHGIGNGPPPTLAETLEEAIRKPGPILVGIGIANHDNVGALFRNALVFGARALLFDETSCHPLYRKALRVSVGTVLTQAWHRGGAGHSILDAVEDAGYRAIALTPKASRRPADLDPSSPYALFLGAEGPGLADDLMERMDGVRIPMAAGIDSLNVATSAAIVLSGLYERRT